MGCHQREGGVFILVRQFVDDQAYYIQTGGLRKPRWRRSFSYLLKKRCGRDLGSVPEALDAQSRRTWERISQRRADENTRVRLILVVTSLVRSEAQLTSCIPLFAGPACCLRWVLSYSSAPPSACCCVAPSSPPGSPLPARGFSGTSAPCVWEGRSATATPRPARCRCC